MPSQYKKKQQLFSGAYLPNMDDSLIGEENYTVLENIRYIDSGLELVGGYSKLEEYNDTHAVTHLVQATDSTILFVTDDYKLYSNQLNPTIVNTGYITADATLIHTFSNVDNLKFTKTSSGEIIITNDYEVYVYNPNRIDPVSVFDYAGEEYFINKTPAVLDSLVNITEYMKNNESYTLQEKNVSGTYYHTIVVGTLKPINEIRITFDGSTASTFTYSTASTPTGNTISVREMYKTGAEGGVKRGGTYTSSTSGSISYGTVSFTAETSEYTELFQPFYVDGYYNYFHVIVLTTSASTSISIKTIEVVEQFCKLEDIWGGVYLSPLYCEAFNGGASQGDYTLEVNAKSSIAEEAIINVGGYSAGTESGGAVAYLKLGFEKPVESIIVNMLNSTNINSNTNIYMYANTKASTFKYLKRDVYSSTALGRKQDYVSFHQYFSVINTTVVKETINGIPMYVYYLIFETASGTSQTLTANTKIDTIQAVPARATVGSFKTSELFKNRIMLASTEKDPNKINFSLPNTSVVFNGENTSDRDNMSIYVGDNSDIVAIRSLSNLYSSVLIENLLILKSNSTYALIGDTTEDFRVVNLSDKYGCISENTIEEASIVLNEDEGSHNVLIWISKDGPVLSNGTTVIKISGIENYFDTKNISAQANDAVSAASNNICINFSEAYTSVSWFDSKYSEYNFIIPIGTKLDGSSIEKKWFVYSTKYNKWFVKVPNNAIYPSSVVDYIYNDATYYIAGVNSKIVPSSFSSKLIGYVKGESEKLAINPAAAWWLTRNSTTLNSTGSTINVGMQNNTIPVCGGDTYYRISIIRGVVIIQPASGISASWNMSINVTSHGYVGKVYLHIVDPYKNSGLTNENWYIENYSAPIGELILDGTENNTSKTITFTDNTYLNAHSGEDIVFTFTFENDYDDDPTLSNIDIDLNTPILNYTGGTVSSLDGNILALERGDSSLWDDTDITGVLITGDFTPENSLWDESLLRNIEVVLSKGKELNSLETFYTHDSGDIFESLKSVSSPTVVNRLYKTVFDLNKSAWLHKLKFVITGDKVRPILYGYKYTIEREDLNG